MNISHKVDVAVLGASGYIGLELLKRLSDHPHVNLIFLGSESLAGELPSTLFPPLRRNKIFKQKKFQPIAELSESDVVISALPLGVLPELLPTIELKTKKIINISGDFRLKQKNEIIKYYPKSLELNDKINYQYVVPEFENNLSARLLNMPGCVASAVIYGLVPLAEQGLLDETLIIDTKVGSSGAGKKQSDNHSVRTNNAKTYKLFYHRHAPEIKQYLNDSSATLKHVLLTVTSIDISRGILVHVYGRLKSKLKENELYPLYRKAYKDHPFLHITCLKNGTERLPSIKVVQGTNDCEIGFALDEESQHFVVTVTLDNLVKGGAGNAIQTLNKLYNFDLNLGLRSNITWP